MRRIHYKLTWNVLNRLIYVYTVHDRYRYAWTWGVFCTTLNNKTFKKRLHVPVHVYMVTCQWQCHCNTGTCVYNLFMTCLFACMCTLFCFFVLLFDGIRNKNVSINQFTMSPMWQKKPKKHTCTGGFRPCVTPRMSYNIHLWLAYLYVHYFVSLY